MCNTNDVITQMSTMAAYSVSSVRSSANFEEAGQYELGRLGFSDLSLKDEQCLSKGSSVFMWLLALERVCVIKSSLL